MPRMLSAVSVVARNAALLLVACLLRPALAFAHPVPFSYVDLHVEGAVVDVDVVVHVYDVAHDLGVAAPDRMADARYAASRAADIQALLRPRLTLLADDRTVSGEWSIPEVLAERQSLRLRVRYACARSPYRLTVASAMFPYDPNHQTFLNIYDGTALTQAILGGDHRTFDYFPGTAAGAVGVLAKFIPAGIHHILIGPDHLLFLVGLLLLGGSARRLATVVTAFTVAHSLTLSLAALDLVAPSGRVIEPAIALSIVYVGADNLLVRRGRDVREWIAFGFGLIHGFGFASVLREMSLPPRALGWSLFGFNAGVEIGQLLVVLVVASALAMLRRRSEAASSQLAFAGSIVVMAAGAFWFVQRVFFSTGA